MTQLPLFDRRPSPAELAAEALRRMWAQPPPATVLDPFHGSGTSGSVAVANRRNYIGVDISQEYLDEHDRISGTQVRLL